MGFFFFFQRFDIRILLRMYIYWLTSPDFHLSGMLLLPLVLFDSICLPNLVCMYFSFRYFWIAGQIHCSFFIMQNQLLLGFLSVTSVYSSTYLVVYIVKYFFFFLSTKPTWKSCLIQDSSNPFCICFCFEL